MLDIGCNNGDFTLELSAVSSCEPYGMDIDPELVDMNLKKGIKSLCADANHNFPYNDDFFDIIVSNQVMEHVNNTDNFLREIHRILKPSGYAIISTPNISSIHNLGMLMLGKQPFSFHVSEIQVGNPLYGVETHGHVKIFTISAFKDLAKYHNLRIEKIFGSGYYYCQIKISKFVSKILPRYSIYIYIYIYI